MQRESHRKSRNWIMGSLAVLLAACGPSQEPPAEPPADTANNAIATGEDLFDKNCGACHGAGGRGPSLVSLKALSSEELRAAITNHPTAGQIPARLPAREISDLIEFLEE